jgi:hypothetical protein
MKMMKFDWRLARSIARSMYGEKKLSVLALGKGISIFKVYSYDVFKGYICEASKTNKDFIDKLKVTNPDLRLETKYRYKNLVTEMCILFIITGVKDDTI